MAAGEDPVARLEQDHLDLLAGIAGIAPWALFVGLVGHGPCPLRRSVPAGEMPQLATVHDGSILFLFLQQPALCLYLRPIPSCGNGLSRRLPSNLALIKRRIREHGKAI